MSLGEAVVAIFLILSAVMVTITLFHHGLRYGRTTESRTLAAVFGRKVMNQIRSWARDPNNFPDRWDDYRGREVKDPDFPGFVAQVGVGEEPRILRSPCSQLESMYAPRDYQLRKSVFPVSVVVVWGQPEQQFKLVSLVGEPDREAAPEVTIHQASGPPDPVPVNSVVEFEAELLDSGGKAIPDVRFHWFIVSREINGGNATLQPENSPRDGSSMKLIHQVRWFPLLEPPRYGSVPGKISVQAVCHYRGKEIVGEYQIELQ